MSWRRIEAVAWIVFSAIIAYVQVDEYPILALLLAMTVGLWLAILLRREV